MFCVQPDASHRSPLADGTVGAGRDEAARASRARKAKEAKALAARNEAMRQRIANTKAVTDDDLMDEAAGAARAQMAADSKAKKAKQALELAKSNAAMPWKVKKTKSKPATSVVATSVWQPGKEAEAGSGLFGGLAV